MKTYNPSNGTEEMLFTSEFCDNCSKEKRCPILTDKMLNGYDSKRKEWIYDEEKKPTCLNFKKIGTPSGPRTRKKDPDQLEIF